MEFHISGKARKHYDFSDKLFTYNGNVIFADLRAVREFTAKINIVRAKEGKEPMSIGEMNALGLLDEIMHAFLDQYRKQYAPRLNIEAYDWLDEKLGSEKLDEVLNTFCEEFPPLAVLQNKQTVAEYLDTTDSQGLKNRYDTVEELLMLWITNRNPAAMRLAGELFDETALVEKCDYNKAILQLDQFARTQPPIEGMSFVDFLRVSGLLVVVVVRVAFSIFGQHCQSSARKTCFTCAFIGVCHLFWYVIVCVRPMCIVGNEPVFWLIGSGTPTPPVVNDLACQHALVLEARFPVGHEIVVGEDSLAFGALELEGLVCTHFPTVFSVFLDAVAADWAA